MPEAAIFVRAIGDYCELVGDSLPDLRALVNATVRKPVRRVGRFIQLALIGAVRCVGDAALPPDTAVYLTSRRGDLEVINDMMEALFRDGSPPRPLSFINTVSNAACFYVAKNFDLHGRSCFSGGAHFAFETALDLALLEMRAGFVNSALVGCVEIATKPLAVHRRRLELGTDDPIAEAGHWLWLQRGASEEQLGEIAGVEFFEGSAALCTWFESLGLDATKTLFARGQFLGAQQAADIQNALGLAQSFDYRAGRGYYDCQSGALVSAFLREGRDPAHILHVNAEPGGRLAAIVATRL